MIRRKKNKKYIYVFLILSGTSSCTFVQNVCDKMKGRRGGMKKKARCAEAHREIILMLYITEMNRLALA